MAKGAPDIANELIGHLRRLDSTRRKLEALFSAGEIKRHDIEQVYVGLYLDAIVSFERYMEEIFLGYLTNRIALTSKVHPRVTFVSNIVAREVVLGGKSYVDWFPYDQTIKRADAFFRGGMPFRVLTNSDKNTIVRLMEIRNAMAHKSSHSIKVFERNVLGSLPLTGKERSPQGFLRSIFRHSPSQTRYENYIIDMAQIARKIAAV